MKATILGIHGRNWLLETVKEFFDLLEDVEVENHESNDGDDGRGQGRVADVAKGVPPDVGRVQPQFCHVVLDSGLVVVAHLVNK